MTASVLQLADSTKKRHLVTDASDCAVAGVLLQEGCSNDWHPIAYISRTIMQHYEELSCNQAEDLAVIHALHTQKIYFYKPLETVTDNILSSCKPTSEQRT